jgi:hypothetical protein
MMMSKKTELTLQLDWFRTGAVRPFALAGVLRAPTTLAHVYLL